MQNNQSLMVQIFEARKSGDARIEQRLLREADRYFKEADTPSKSPGDGYKMVFGEWRKVGADGKPIDPKARSTYDTIHGAAMGSAIAHTSGAVAGAIKGAVTGGVGGAIKGAVKGAISTPLNTVAGTAMGGALAGRLANLDTNSRTGKYAKSLGKNSMSTMENEMKFLNLAVKGAAIAAVGIGIVAVTKNVKVAAAITKFMGSGGLSKVRTVAHVTNMGLESTGKGMVGAAAIGSIANYAHASYKSLKHTYNFIRNKQS